MWCRIKAFWKNNGDIVLTAIVIIAAIGFLVVMTPKLKKDPPREIDREINNTVAIINGLVNLVAELQAAHESKPDVVEHDGKKLTAIGTASFMVYRDEKGNLFVHDALDSKYIEYGQQK